MWYDVITGLAQAGGVGTDGAVGAEDLAGKREAAGGAVLAVVDRAGQHLSPKARC